MVMIQGISTMYKQIPPSYRKADRKGDLKGDINEKEINVLSWVFVGHGTVCPTRYIVHRLMLSRKEGF